MVINLLGLVIIRHFKAFKPISFDFNNFYQKYLIDGPDIVAPVIHTSAESVVLYSDHILMMMFL